MSISDGIVWLTRIHEFVKEHPKCYLERHTEEGKKRLSEYSKLCTEITASIQEACGVYLWGYYERGLWRNVYLGCAGFRKTASLRSRIREELWDEKCFAWAPVVGKGAIGAINDSGHRHRERAMRKMGSSAIVWVATPELENEIIHDLESDLIEALNPQANRSRPTPPHSLQKDTEVVFQHLRKQIHLSRPF